MTKHVRMAKTENLTMDDTSVRKLTGLLPVILSPSYMGIIINEGKLLLPVTGETERLSFTTCVHLWSPYQESLA